MTGSKKKWAVENRKVGSALEEKESSKLINGLFNIFHFCHLTLFGNLEFHTLAPSLLTMHYFVFGYGVHIPSLIQQYKKENSKTSLWSSKQIKINVEWSVYVHIYKSSGNWEVKGKSLWIRNRQASLFAKSFWVFWRMFFG